MIGNDQTCSTAGNSWTTWFNYDDPSGREDNETKENYIQRGYSICNSPTALEVLVKHIKIYYQYAFTNVYHFCTE